LTKYQKMLIRAILAPAVVAYLSRTRAKSGAVTPVILWEWQQMSKKKEIPSLVRALEFVSLAQRDKGAPYQTHVILKDKRAVAFDGILAAGHMIDEDLDACPHTMTLLAALKQCTGALSISQLPTMRLSIKSGKFKAFVPCTENIEMQSVGPDPVAGVIDNRLRDGLAVVSPFIAENSQRVVMASACIRANSLLATNGHLLLEYWHGISLPPDMIVPKLFINAICKIKKNLTHFGFSDTTLTIYFEDGSWLRTQLYKERWPNCDEIMSRTHNAQPVPVGFFEAVEAVEGFAEENRVHIGNGGVASTSIETAGAVHEVEGLTAKAIMNLKHLMLMRNLIKRIDFVGNNGVSHFYGDNLRGALTHFKE